mmetsp:Transcript_41165/g.73803  ORF Transcript_41165/g.73803 Transcript_41165/m.73803 type:complete len:208 (+) Transcript_41165:3-626(+)
MTPKARPRPLWRIPCRGCRGCIAVPRSIWRDCCWPRLMRWSLTFGGVRRSLATRGQRSQTPTSTVCRWRRRPLQTSRASARSSPPTWNLHRGQAWIAAARCPPAQAPQSRLPPGRPVLPVRTRAGVQRSSAPRTQWGPCCKPSPSRGLTAPSGRPGRRAPPLVHFGWRPLKPRIGGSGSCWMSAGPKCRVWSWRCMPRGRSMPNCWA